MSLASGKLRHKVTLQKRESTQDPVTGEAVFDWVDAARVWASVEPLSAREFVNSKSQQSDISARITIRYRDAINGQMRILHRGKVYDISAPLADPDSGLEYITLPVSSGVSEG
jgi:SPP1 family predicted phage head-tail adaptor